MNDESRQLSRQPWSNEDRWSSLKAFTAARIALGRAGSAIPTKELLEFQLAHAHARDAVYSQLSPTLIHDLAIFNRPLIEVSSLAKDRHEYLKRPDLGRVPDAASLQSLTTMIGNFDLCICIADGLSATGINHHVRSLLALLLPACDTAELRLSPICVIQQGRVAIGDHLSPAVGARLSLMLIGERPGLSSSDSIGAYITYEPVPGKTDEMRNCVSNIRPGGLAFDVAVQKIMFLILESRRLELSGVQLKENAGLPGKSGEQ